MKLNLEFVIPGEGEKKYRIEGEEGDREKRGFDDYYHLCRSISSSESLIWRNSLCYYYLINLSAASVSISPSISIFAFFFSGKFSIFFFFSRFCAVWFFEFQVRLSARRAVCFIFILIYLFIIFGPKCWEVMGLFF